RSVGCVCAMLASVTVMEVTGPTTPETTISLGYMSAGPRVTAGCPRGILMAALLLNDCAVADAAEAIIRTAASPGAALIDCPYPAARRRREAPSPRMPYRYWK